MGDWTFADAEDMADRFDTEETQGLVDDAVQSAVESIAERMEKELYGAWRAGYNYVHVYKSLDYNGLRRDAFTIGQLVLPSNTEQPPRPDTAAYQYTYDLTAVPEAALREAWRTGEVPEEYREE